MNLDIEQGKLHIKKRSIQEWMVLVLFLTPFITSFLTEFIGLPSFLRYIVDVILVCFGVMLITKRYFIVNHKLKPFLVIIFGFLAYVTLVYLFNYQSVFYFLWGIRNTFRFYLAFVVFALFLSEEEAQNIFKILDILFWIDFALVILQFTFLDVAQDQLGGIFGISLNTNGYTLIFLSIVISRTLLLTFDGKSSVVLCIAKCFASLLIAAMAEIKMFILMFIILMVLTMGMTRFTKRKFLILIFASLAVWLSYIVLTDIFSEFSGFLSFERLFDSATRENYSNNRDLNRLSAVYMLAKNYITDIPQQLFGMGIGNCDTSDLAIFNSTYYQNHSYLHYTWFASAMSFLETGIIGMLIYLSFFATCFINSLKQIIQHKGNILFCKMAMILSIVSVILFVYNQSIRIESGYMVYFVLALPFLANQNVDIESMGGK